MGTSNKRSLFDRIKVKEPNTTWNLLKHTMSETKSILQTVASHQTFKMTFSTTVCYVRTYLETFKQTLKTHNGNKRREKGGGNLGRKKKIHLQILLKKKMGKK